MYNMYLFKVIICSTYNTNLYKVVCPCIFTYYAGKMLGRKCRNEKEATLAPEAGVSVPEFSPLS